MSQRTTSPKKDPKESTNSTKKDIDKIVKLEQNKDNSNVDGVKLFSYNKGKKDNFSMTKIIRVDAKGNSIVKGQKKHCVTFCDLIGKKSITDMVEVESFKKYNVDVSSYGDDTGCACKCLII